MRRWICAGLAGIGLLSGGCHNGNTTEVSTVVPADVHASDVRDDNVRLAGVDRSPPPPFELGGPLYLLPLTALGAGFHFVVVQPISYLVDRYIYNDTASRAAREMLDDNSADNRRWGTLRLAQESYARQGHSEQVLWTSMGLGDKDYTVRAAAIRALNWARAPGHADLFLAGLKDDQALVRVESAKALANLPDPAALSDLLDHLAHDSSADVRIACADALRCYKNQDAARGLIDVLQDRDFSVAWEARQSLILMTAHDFAYDPDGWTTYMAGAANPFT